MSTNRDNDRNTNQTEHEDGRRMSGLKASEGGRGDPDKASPAAIERYLKGINFPSNKQGLISRAKENNAPDDVLRVLDRFEEKDYHTVIDVSKEVGRVE